MPIFPIIIGFIVLFAIGLGFHCDFNKIVPAILWTICLGLVLWTSIAGLQADRYETSYYNVTKIKHENREYIVSIIDKSLVNACEVTNEIVKDTEDYYLERKVELCSGGIDWMSGNCNYRFVPKKDCDGKTKIVNE